MAVDKSESEYGAVPSLPRPEPLRWQTRQIPPVVARTDVVAYPPKQANDNRSR